MNYDAIADLYARQYASYRDDIGFYSRLADRLGATRVLEVGAGAGRVTVPLARRGLSLTGVDPSGRMLDRGRAHAVAEGVEVEWIQADIRWLDLNRRRWPLAIAPFNALMHLYSVDDQDRALERIRAHLEPRGTLAFDLYLPRFGPQGVLRHELETFVDPDGSRTDVIVVQRVDEAAQLATTTYLVDTVAPDGALSREVLELTQRYFTRFEVERWLRAFGFRAAFAGNLEGGRLGPESRHLVVTALLEG